MENKRVLNGGTLWDSAGIRLLMNLSNLNALQQIFLNMFNMAYLN